MTLRTFVIKDRVKFGILKHNAKVSCIYGFTFYFLTEKCHFSIFLVLN